MSEEKNTPVEVKKDEGARSLGKSPYFSTAQGHRVSIFIAMGLMTIIFGVMLYTKKPEIERNGKPIPSPGISKNDPGINPKLLTEKDLINVIAHPKVERSFLGKIHIVSLRSISELPVGSEMKAVLDSGGTDGIVKARLTTPLVVDGEPVLPQEAVLFGKGKSGEDRLFIEFTKAILPTGEAYPIRAQAFDSSDRIQGLKGEFVGTKTKKMAGAIAFGFMGGMADGLQSNTNGSIFMQQQRPSVRDGALNGASKAALDQSQAFMEEMKNSPNIIEVKSGTPIIVITDEPKAKRDL